MINVLQIVPSLAVDSGVTRFVTNLDRYVDHDRFHFDYFHHSVANGKLLFPASLDNEIEAAGSKVYTVTHGKVSPRRFAQEAGNLLGNVAGRYDIAHCHVPNNAFVTLKACYRAGVGVRIVHSHLNSSSDNALHRVRNAPLIALGKRYANAYCSCSSEAGQYLFGKTPFEVINNGICLEDFAFDSSVRNSLRAELGIPAKGIVIGCVGRLTKQKNYHFALKVFNEYLKREHNAWLIIVGDGEDKRFIESRIKELGLVEKVQLMGVRDDISYLYSLFDVFFMPSLYEGLPVSAVEAQAAGLPCVFSSGVPAESDIIGKAEFVPLDVSLAEWSNALAGMVKRGRTANPDAKLTASGYSAKASAEKLMNYYERLVAEAVC